MADTERDDNTIGLVDDDEVDESNLQRQIIHTTDRVGMNKGESAKQAIAALNPEVQVNVHPFRINRDNVLDLVSQYDVIVDGADNFPTRYLLADASLMTNTPLVHASILRFEGHASVFKPYDGPCYRCLFPEPPPPDLAPSCGEAGVLGVLCGVMGNIQATEAIKVLREVFSRMISHYLRNRENLVCTFILVDVRHDPQALDLAFMTQLAEWQLPFAIVFTKADKLTKAAQVRAVENYQRRLLETWEECPPNFLTSAATGKGKEALLDYLEGLIPVFVAPQSTEQNP
jgi:molybdopterin/thiamine biosynthesis adenylyltransferase